LIAAFNRLIERGLPRSNPGIIISDEMEEELKSRPVALEKLPSWVEKVPKLSEALVIPNTDGSVPEERLLSPHFLSMNIMVERPLLCVIPGYSK
jgi:hypothetical protein